MKAALEIISTIFKWLFKKWEIKNDPVNKEIEEKKRFDEAIAKGDSRTVNIIVAERLRRANAQKRAGGNK